MTTTLSTGVNPGDNDAANASILPAQAPSGELDSARASVLTVEIALWAIVILFGAGLRLGALGSALMAPLEAHAAWPAWLAASAQTVANAPVPESALLHSLQVGLFWLMGQATETAARLPSALIGCVILWLPWFWRDRLGRSVALILAVLLAVDPWLVTLSRTGTSGILSAGLALVALTALHRLTVDDSPHSTAQVVAGGALGLLLISGPHAVSWLLLVALYLGTAGRSAWRPLIHLRGLVSLAVAAIFGATLFLSRPQDVSLVTAGLSAWLEQFSSGAYDFGYPWLRLLVDQPLVFAFGLAGLVGLWVTPLDAPDRSFRRFLTGWVLLGLVLWLLPGRTPESLTMAGIAFAIAAAVALGWVLQRLAAQTNWSEGVLMLLLTGVVLVALTFRVWHTVSAMEPDGTALAILLTMAGVLIVIYVGYALYVSRSQAALIAVVALFAALALASIASMTRLAYLNTSHRPNGFWAAFTSQSAGAFAEDVHTLSDRRTGDDTELPVWVVMGAQGEPDPLIGWLLRDMRNLAFYLEAPADPASMATVPPLVVTQAAAAGNPGPAGYIGSLITLTESWLPNDLPSAHVENVISWQTRTRPLLRWLLYREGGPTIPQLINLWAAQ